MPNDINGVYLLRGEAFYAKILGNPVPNYAKDGKEWTIELKPDKDGVELLKKLGLDDRITKGEDKDRILFRQRETTADGTENKPITVVDANNRPWDRETLIGNGSIVDVKIKVKDYGKGKFPGVYPQAVRVLEHVEYARTEFSPLSEEDRYFRGESDDLNDDIPE